MQPEARRLYLSRKEMEAYQLEKLQQTVQRAARTDYFGSRFAHVAIRCLADLQSLPVTTKEDLREASPFGAVAVPHAELFQYHESFGTTGKPVASWLTRRDFEAYAEQINQGALNFGPDDLLVNKFPYSISVPAHIIKLAAQNRGTCVVSASSLTDVCPYTRTLDLMMKLRATVLTCLPTEACLLAAAARALGLDPARDFSLRAIGVAGELLTEARRRRLEQQWNCKVYNFYGTTETGNMAADSETGQMHLSWDHFLCEVIDAEAFENKGVVQVLPEGEMGMPVITTLTREAMPLVRYVLTDRVRLLSQPNAADGRQAPIVQHLGRDINRFTFQNRVVFLGDVESRLFQLPWEALGDIYMVLVTPEKVYFRVEAVQPNPAAYRQVEAQIRAELAVPLEVQPVAPGQLFPIEWLLQPARVGKPSSVWSGPSLAEAPADLPSLWMNPS